MDRLKNILGEALRLLASWFLVWLIVACLVRSLVPDPATQLAGPLTDQATRKLFAQEFGLGRPLAVESAIRSYRMLLGDWGISWRNRIPVRNLVSGPALLSIGLALSATMAALSISLAITCLRPISQHAGYRIGSIFSSSTPWLFLAAIPAFVTGLWITHSQLPTILGLPWQGYRSAGVPLWQTLLLPAFCLTLPGLGLALPRFLATRREIISSSWYQRALAAGLPSRQVLVTQGWPFFSAALGDTFAQVLLASVTGAVAVEYVFSLPGLGTLLVDAVQLADVPVLLGVVATTTILTFVALAIRAVCALALPPSLRPASVFH